MDMRDLEARVLALKEEARLASEESIRLQEQSKMAQAREAEALYSLSTEYGVSSLDQAKALLASKLSALENALTSLESELSDA